MHSTTASHEHQHQPEQVQGGVPGHVHDSAHPDSHAGPSAHAHSHEAHFHVHEQAPEQLENLILDIGAGTGALMIRADIGRDQAEIEISPVGDQQARTHNIVRRRQAPSGAGYAAVFPAVPAGDYVVWRDAATPAGTVTIHGGHVASFSLH
jgi:hypothetical protein